MLQDAHLVRRLGYRSLGGVLVEGKWWLSQLDRDDGLAKFDLIPPAKVISFDVCL